MDRGEWNLDDVIERPNKKGVVNTQVPFLPSFSQTFQTGEMKREKGIWRRIGKWGFFGTWNLSEIGV